MEYRIVVVGTSLGGLHAMRVLLSGLSDGFPMPIAIVQHRGPESDGMLRDRLQRHTPLQVREPFDKEPIRPSRVYLAPANYHLLVEPDLFSLSVDAPVNFARPSIDVLFESAADAYGADVVALVMTGAGRDGMAGAARIKRNGGFIVTQEPASAECAHMPRAVASAVTPDCVLPLEEIAPFLNGLGSSPQE